MLGYYQSTPMMQINPDFILKKNKKGIKRLFPFNRFYLKWCALSAFCCGGSLFSVQDWIYI